MGRIYISAGHKSSGKTTLSIGLCAALSQQGKKVQAFKKGPDYIDPLWLANASSIISQRQCYNLDFNTQSKDEIIQTFHDYGNEADISLIEGNKGLYDGVALDGYDSNAAMAKLLQSPVILVIDARGVTRGVAPLLLGYQMFDKDIDIAGVIYNFCGGARHEQKLRAVTEEYTDIPVLGMLRKSQSMDLAERHLGLMPSNETKDAKQKISEIAQFVTGSVDLSGVIDCTKRAPELCETKALLLDSKTIVSNETKVRIGICEDAAFGFYYADDKQAFINAGAELVSINTLEDDGLPENLDGLFIGGGFPETQLQALEENRAMRKSIYGAIEAGLPTYAECGGLMYLSKTIQWKGLSAEMIGIIPADAIMSKKPQGRGYVELEETTLFPWRKISSRDSIKESSGKKIKAHEFHYSSLENLKANGEFAYKVHRGVGVTGEYDGWIYKNLLANYSHLRNTQAYPWVYSFVEFVRSKVNTTRMRERDSICMSTIET